MPLFFPNDPLVEEPTSDKAGGKETNPAPTFLPLDLVAYNLGIRPPGPVENTSGHITEAAAEISYGFLTTCTGSDQSELGVPDLTISAEVKTKPPSKWMSRPSHVPLC